MNSDKKKLKILVLYDPFSTGIGAVADYLEAFKRYSRHHISYAAATNAVSAAPNYDLSIFDVIIIHYSIRLCYDWHLTKEFFDEIKKFKGLKLQIIQDEYDSTEVARKHMEDLGIDIVFTCVPSSEIQKVYPRERFLNTKFVNVLTGYVSLNDGQLSQYTNSYKNKKILIGYRGRKLPYWYGDLGREKYLIGKGVKSYCEKNNIACDIEWSEDKRIYGEAWYKFLGSCIATLGSESGSNFFDWDGSAKKIIEKKILDDPKISYESVRQKYLVGGDGLISMNQISPRIFESIAVKSCLVLFEGKYSNVIEPNVHFLPLKKDFSNLSEIVLKLRDEDLVESMVTRAYEDVLGNGTYSYESLVRKIEAEIDASHVNFTSKSSLIFGLAGVSRENNFDQKCFDFKNHKFLIDEYLTEFYRGLPTDNYLAPPDGWISYQPSKNQLNKVKPFSIESPLQFYDGHDPQLLINDFRGADSYVAAKEGQHFPQLLSFKFDKPFVLKRLDLSWYNLENFATDIKVIARNQSLYQSELLFSNLSEHIQFLEVNIDNEITELDLIVNRLNGQQRVLLSSINFWGTNTSSGSPNLEEISKYSVNLKTYLKKFLSYMGLQRRITSIINYRN